MNITLRKTKTSFLFPLDMVISAAPSLEVAFQSSAIQMKLILTLDGPTARQEKHR
jgi:hypothetical protein